VGEVGERAGGALGLGVGRDEGVGGERRGGAGDKGGGLVLADPGVEEGGAQLGEVGRGVGAGRGLVGPERLHGGDAPDRAPVAADDRGDVAGAGAVAKQARDGRALRRDEPRRDARAARPRPAARGGPDAHRARRDAHLGADRGVRQRRALVERAGVVLHVVGQMLPHGTSFAARVRGRQKKGRLAGSAGGRMSGSPRA
jgi:hypothetical protein